MVHETGDLLAQLVDDVAVRHGKLLDIQNMRT